MNDGAGIVLRANEPDKDFNVFTEEALAAQDGKKVPLTLEVGGPVVGEATLKYHPESKVLTADLRVGDPNLAELFKKNPPNIFG